MEADVADHGTEPFPVDTLTAYRRTWLRLIAWAAAEGLALETLPAERAGELYHSATHGRSASHHLQVKAALALRYKVLGSADPFIECLAPKFQIEKTEMRYHTALQLGQLLAELREDRRTYFGATALFLTGARFHEWALLGSERLVREPGGAFIVARMQVKGGSFRDRAGEFGGIKSGGRINRDQFISFIVTSVIRSPDVVNTHLHP